MALNRTVVFDIRTTGDDLNGGGFNTASGGTDYSQQDAAQLSLTDCATSGTGVTTLTSATGGFTAAMVGNVIHLSSGTNLTTGFYEITGFTDTNTVTLDRSPDDGVGGVSGATGKVGGSLATPGVMRDIVFSDGNEVWIKSGTYTLSTGTAGPGGPVTFLSANLANILISGYNSTHGDLSGTVGSANRPLLDRGTVTGFSYIWSGVNSSVNVLTQHICIDCQGYNGGINQSGYSFHDCKVVDFDTNGFNVLGIVTCCQAEGDFTSSDIGFSRCTHIANCIAFGCSVGIILFSNDSATNCLSYQNDVGIEIEDGSSFASNCTAYNNDTDGFQILHERSVVINCHSEANGGFAYFHFEDSGNPSAIINCSDFNNTSGRENFSGNATYLKFETNPVSLTAQGITSATDLSPNDTAGGGALLRNAAVDYDSSQSTLLDIGGVNASGSASATAYSLHPLAYN